MSNKLQYKCLSILPIEYGIIRSHKGSPFLRLLQIIKGERWADARSSCARARTYTQSASCSFKLRSLSQGGQERAGGGVWTLRSSRGFREYTVQTQTRQSVREPDEFLDSTSIWRVSRRTSARRKRSRSDSGIRYVCRDDSMPAQQLERLSCIWLWCLLYVYCDPRRCWKKNRRVRNVRRRSHGTLSYVLNRTLWSRDNLFKSWTVFNSS